MSLPSGCLNLGLLAPRPPPLRNPIVKRCPFVDVPPPGATHEGSGIRPQIDTPEQTLISKMATELRWESAAVNHRWGGPNGAARSAFVLARGLDRRPGEAGISPL